MLNYEYELKKVESYYARDKKYGDIIRFGVIKTSGSDWSESFYNPNKEGFFIGEIIERNYNTGIYKHEGYFEDAKEYSIGEKGEFYNIYTKKNGCRYLVRTKEKYGNYWKYYYPPNYDEIELEKLRFVEEIRIEGIKYSIYYGLVKYEGGYAFSSCDYDSLFDEPQGYHGFGKLYFDPYETGDKSVLKYEGEWFSGEREGFGKSRFEDGKLEYRGEWYSDIKQGYGELFSKNTEEMIYQGHFYQGEYDGYGEVFYENNTYESKTKFIGNFSRGFPEEGILFDKNGNVVFDGKFSDFYNFALDNYSGEGDISRSQTTMDSYLDQISENDIDESYDQDDFW